MVPRVRGDDIFVVAPPSHSLLHAQRDEAGKPATPHGKNGHRPTRATPIWSAPREIEDGQEKGKYTSAE